MRPAPYVAAILLLAPCPTIGAGESIPSIPAGARVRLTLPCEAMNPSPRAPGSGACRQEGRVVAVEGDTITLAAAESTHSHRLSATSRIEVSRGSRSRWLAGAGVGFVVGTAGTYALLNQGGSTNPCDRSANQDAIGPAACVGLAAVGGVAGAGAGALIGRLFRTERWQEVPVEGLRVTLGPRPGVGLHVTVALGF